MLAKYGAIRLQFSVYEVNNTNRVIDNMLIAIEDMFSKKFSGADSVIIFDVASVKLKKYGNAIHRDVDVVYF
ncbi:MAG: CRISPR-associated endonuclease Cas2 [Bacteroidaceae bacterium]|nr:CRISPR-associated endonuclease Cas2 [Bacteroidaceae bacterium]